MELLTFLHENSHITDTSLYQIKEYSQTWKCTSYDALVESHLFTENDIANILASAMQVERLYKLGGMKISQDIVSYMPFKTAIECCCIPFEASAEQEWIKIVFFNPLDKASFEKISNTVHVKIKPAVAERSEIIRAIKLFYPLADQLS